MQFDEKQLVDMFWEEHLWGHFPPDRYDRGDGHRYKRPYTKNLKATREYTLPSGRRIDLLIRNRTMRKIWVAEFKVEATMDAIIQVSEYATELTEFCQKRTGIFALAKCVAAQFFHPHAIWTANELNIQLLHLTPLNKSELRVEDISDSPSNKFLKINSFNFLAHKKRRMAVANG